jgi:hypothetical protein
LEAHEDVVTKYPILYNNRQETSESPITKSLFTQSKEIMSTPSTTWQERLSIAKHFNMTDPQILSTFGATPIELTTANSLVAKGIIKVQPLSEVDQLVWATKLTQTAKPTEIIASTSLAAPQSTIASSNAKPQAKRGRTGNKIVNALNSVPTIPTPVDSFLAEHKISKTILRQSKRFLPVPIKISIRVDKTTGVEMISRCL